MNLPSQVFRKLRLNTTAILLFIIDNIVSFLSITGTPDMHIIKENNALCYLKTQSVF